MIQEVYLVALLASRPLGLPRGDVITVVHIYNGGNHYEVESTNAKGDTIAVEPLIADEAQAVDLCRVMVHYSDLENAA